MAEPDDAQLVTDAKAGDTAALSRLLQRHGPAVRRALDGRIPQRWQAMLAVDDVLQQTYVDAIRDIRRLDASEPNAVPRWLTTMAKRNLVDALRMLETLKRGGDRARVEQRRDESCVGLYEHLAATSTTPSRVVARREAVAALEAALEELPADYRRVVELLDLDGQTAETVAAELGRSPGAVYMVRARAHRLLGEKLSRSSRF